MSGAPVCDRLCGSATPKAGCKPALRFIESRHELKSAHRDRGPRVARTFLSAGSGDFRVASSSGRVAGTLWNTGLESPVNPRTGMSALQAAVHGCQTARQNFTGASGGTALVTFNVLPVSVLVATGIQLVRLLEHWTT